MNKCLFVHLIYRGINIIMKTIEIIRERISQEKAEQYSEFIDDAVTEIEADEHGIKFDIEELTDRAEVNSQDIGIEKPGSAANGGDIRSILRKLGYDSNPDFSLQNIKLILKKIHNDKKARELLNWEYKKAIENEHAQFMRHSKTRNTKELKLARLNKDAQSP